MTTLITICVANLHRSLRYWICDCEHASPLPWVFTGIGKENVFPLNVKTPIVLICLNRGVSREVFSKNSIAVVGPER